MKLLISVMLSALITDIASSRSWQQQHTLSSKTRYEHKGCNCLNGGACISYSLFSQIKRCSCPKGYRGKHCEIDIESQCYAGSGEDYRGTKSVSKDNERCLDWNSALLRRKLYNDGLENAMELGLGKHNYCRNPDGQSKPWCYVWKGYQISSASCDIPMCYKPSTCGQRSYSKLFKIVGGHQAAIESQPWIASIFQYVRRGDYNQFLCGGSLIDPCWVLTAAHCFQSKTPDTSQLTVFLGKSALNATDSKEQTFNVDKIVIHQQFTQERMDYDNDIALLRIRSSSGQCAEESRAVKTICLPSQDLVLKDNFRCEVSGYGKESRTEIYYSRILKSTNVNLISQSLCREVYYSDRKLNGNMLCAGDAQWKTDACQGDSGGPLVCEFNNRMVLYGIVSWGDGCAKEQKPGVYTRVTKYLSWIEGHMKEVHFKSYYPPK
ncbi:urokinase-type plasminogen activator [Hemicordylus capensis]|uniref:urokinase-type plasminogen activator n=1 Tax=Hemicordylus capensis TaxID=884348 RepID=UPI002303F28A|nr:urokinase-type plasminogen activator [Hemicordylus capensis]